MSDRPLPWQPEPLASLRARYHEAVAEIVDVESVQMGAALRPGLIRRHVLDHPDGIRLIVSRERLPDGRVYTHASASAWVPAYAPHLRAQLDAVPMSMRLALILGQMAQAYRAVSGHTGRLRLICLSPDQGWPHWEVLE